MFAARFVSASLTVALLAAAPVMLSASGNSAQSKDTTAAQIATTKAGSQFAALKGVKAAPMSARELERVKGQDAHFVTVNSQNQLFGMTGLHVVVRNNREHWLDLGNGILVAPAYRGLCDAALKSPGMVIPGQNPTTGIGGGC